MNVPANTTHIFQPLDLTVNGYCQRSMKKKFAELCSKQVRMKLEKRKDLESIDVKFLLITLKLLMITGSGSAVSVIG